MSNATTDPISLGGSVAILGGTGALGAALTRRWAAAGLEVVVGSRNGDRAAKVAERIASEIALTEGHVVPKGAHNVEAARDAWVVVLAVPYSAQRETLDQVCAEILGKLLISAVVPLDPKDPGTWSPPAKGSAAAEVQSALGADVQVVTAFQNVSAAALASGNKTLENDVLVCGDDDGAKQLAIGLVEYAGLRAFDAGPLANAAVVEGLTAVLIDLNRKYQGNDAGLRVLGLKATRM